MTNCSCDTFTATGTSPACNVNQTGSGTALSIATTATTGSAALTINSNTNGGGILVQTTNNTANAIYASAEGSGNAVYGTIGAFGNGAGIYGLASYGNAIYGLCTGSGNAVKAATTTGTAVLATTTTGPGVIVDTAGGPGITITNTGTGVGLQSTIANGNGIVSATNATSGCNAVVGNAMSGSCTGVAGNSYNGIGVYGSSSNDWIGVEGKCTAGTGYGGIGVSAYSTSALGFGLSAYCTVSGGIGAYIQGASNAYSIYAPSGPLYVHDASTFTGYLTKSGGGFLIDHPQDPANKLLNHCFVESPDMKNLYDGIVVLDEKGNADVSLPSYFEAANSDFRYTLTAIGASAPGLFVSKEVENCQFSIGGGVAGMKVSWQITGVRADKWALANHPGVEITKKVSGTYMTPELHGADKTKHMHYREESPAIKSQAISEGNK